jgi:hypothetical protein
MPERNPPGERVERVAEQPGSFGFRRTCDQRTCIGSHFGLEQVESAEFGQQLDDVALARRFLCKNGSDLLPDLVNRSHAVHRSHDHVAGGRQAVHAAGRVILHDVPNAAPIPMSVHRGVVAKLRPADGDIPALMAGDAPSSLQK